MTAAERVIYSRLHKRAALLNPELAAAVLFAFAALRAELTDDELAHVVALGFADRLLDQALSQAVMAYAFYPLRERLRQGIVQGVKYVARDFPSAKARTLTISFDTLHPSVVTAIQKLETRVIGDLQASIRETVRSIVEQGIKDGLNGKAIGARVRPLVGLGVTQLQEVENYRDALLGQNGRSVTDYERRNRRYDTATTPAQVEKAVAAYTKARIALNAESVARTAALDAHKLAQRLAWQTAVIAGIADGSRLMRDWLGVDDDRERPSHLAMNGESQPWNQPYSNGQSYAGEGEYGCRCLDRYYISPI